MTIEDEIAEREEIERLNERLSDSLDRCREILSDCQTKLEASANEPFITTGGKVRPNPAD